MKRNWGAVFGALTRMAPALAGVKTFCCYLKGCRFLVEPAVAGLSLVMRAGAFVALEQLKIHMYDGDSHLATLMEGLVDAPCARTLQSLKSSRHYAQWQRPLAGRARGGHSRREVASASRVGILVEPKYR